MVKMHQHVGPDGKPFGKPHPKAAAHANKRTQQWHEFTLGVRTKPPNKHNE